jgi:hypothetical protein
MYLVLLSETAALADAELIDRVKRLSGVERLATAAFFHLYGISRDPAGCIL